MVGPLLPRGCFKKACSRLGHRWGYGCSLEIPGGRAVGSRRHEGTDSGHGVPDSGKMDLGAKDTGRKVSDKRGEAITCKCYGDGEPGQGTWGAGYGEDGYGGLREGHGVPHRGEDGYAGPAQEKPTFSKNLPCSRGTMLLKATFNFQRLQHVAF